MDRLAASALLAPMRRCAVAGMALLALLGCRQIGDPVTGGEAVSLVEATKAYHDLVRDRAAAGRATHLQAIDFLDGWWRIDAVDGRRDRVDVVAKWRVHRSDGRIERRAPDGAWAVVEP